MNAERRALGLTLAVTCVTAWFSYAYFAIDEHFQVVEPAFHRLGLVPEGALPWELHERMRPWLQPFLYVLVGRAIGARDPFVLAFAFRLVTGLLCVGALALYLRTTLPWFSGESRRLHLRVATLAGFLPYLFVRTSSETSSMAAATAAFALLLEGATPGDGPRRFDVPVLARPGRLFLVGLLFGAAFEARYHTAFLTLGLLAWLVVAARARLRPLAAIFAGGLAALGLGALVDRWGYGVFCFPAWTYFRANILEGASGYFGSEPPFAYFWILPANVFFPIVVPLLVLSVVAWLRFRWHPLTWATAPFFLAHNLVAHKEERFVFPIAILATGLVTLALRRPPKGRWPKALLAVNVALMALLAVYPIGWNHHVRFMRFVHDHVGDELHAHALPELELGLPAYHPRVYDIEKSDAASIARRIDEGTAKPWLVVDEPRLPPELAGRAELVWTELPSFALLPLVDAYNARAKAPLRRLEYRSLYRITAITARPTTPAP